MSTSIFQLQFAYEEVYIDEIKRQALDTTLSNFLCEKFDIIFILPKQKTYVINTKIQKVDAQNRSAVWLVFQQQCCRDDCQIS